MTKTHKTDRRTCRTIDNLINLSSTFLYKSNTIVDTSRRVRLLQDVHSITDKLFRKKLFKVHNISRTTDYRILKLNFSRRSERVHNRDRKPVLIPYERDVIETVENTSFRFETVRHYVNTSTIDLVNESERLI